MHHSSSCSHEALACPRSVTLYLGCDTALCGLALHSSPRVATCPLLRCEPSFHPHAAELLAACVQPVSPSCSPFSALFPGRRRKCPWLVAGTLCCHMSLPEPLIRRASAVSDSPPLSCSLTSKACAECYSDP